MYICQAVSVFKGGDLAINDSQSFPFLAHPAFGTNRNQVGLEVWGLSYTSPSLHPCSGAPEWSPCMHSAYLRESVVYLHVLCPVY